MAVGWCRCLCQRVNQTSSKKWIYPTATWKLVEFYWFLLFFFYLEFFSVCTVIVLTAGLLLNAKDLIRMGSSALACSENVQEI